MTRCRSRQHSRCNGLTLHSKQCRCKPKRGARYCHKHEHMYRYEKPKECCICFEELSLDDKPTTCGHYMHTECIQRWCSASGGIGRCPLCRQQLTAKLDEKTILFDVLPEDLQQNLRAIYEGLIRLVDSFPIIDVNETL